MDESRRSLAPSLTDGGDEAGAPVGQRRADPSRDPQRRASRLGRTFEHPILSAPALLVVIVAFLLPLGVLVLYSLWATEDGKVIYQFTLDNYYRFFTQSTYTTSLAWSFIFVGIASAISVATTFPLAYFVALKVRPSRRLFWILLTTTPFLTSYLLRVFAWLNLLGDGGAISDALLALHLTDATPSFLEPGRPSVVITFVYLLFPLTFLTTYIAIERMDPATLEAARDLGARPWRSFLRVTLPIARTGLIGGAIFAFVAMMGDYVTPQLIGGSEGYLYSNLVINQFGSSLQWGFGSTLALLLLLSIFLLLVALRFAVGSVESTGDFTRSYTYQRSFFLRAYSLVFVAFLYLPIGVMILLGFNDSSTVGFPFKGFTMRWISAAFSNTVLQDSLWLSLKVAAIAVSISVVLGTAAAVQLSRTRGLLRDMKLAVISLPMFLPPIVLGLAIIIGLNVLGLQRGFWTIIVGHVVITLPIVVLMVLVRLEGMSKELELAALDLGARPWKAFVRVTVPQTLPAIIGAALIAFAFSMDEFIMTFLITGSQSTLPMYIYGSLRFGPSPELNALASLMLVASFLLILVGLLFAFGRKQSILRGAPGDA